MTTTKWTTQSLRRTIVGDSIERKKALERLLRIVRQEERDKVGAPDR